MPAKLDARKIINHFGGVTQCHRLILSSGAVLSHVAVEKWRERDSIPAAWLCALMELSGQSGQQINLSDYLITQLPAQNGITDTAS